MAPGAPAERRVSRIVEFFRPIMFADVLRARVRVEWFSETNRATCWPTDAAARLTRADAPQATAELSRAQLSSYEPTAPLASKVEIVGA